MTEPITLPADDASELTTFDVGTGFDDWTVVADEHLTDRRWYALRRLVIRHGDGQHYAATYKAGHTEGQEDIDPFDDADTVEFAPVVARTRMVEVTEYVAEGSGS